MPQFKSDHVYFHANQITATFSDGHNVHYKDDDIRAIKSPAGDDLLIFRQGQDNHRVRLYLTTPDHDWRHNVTYQWKLSNAWMSIPGTEHDGDQTEWLYWNIENNVNSQIKVWSPSALFECESITLHFQELSRTPWKNTQEVVLSTKVVLKGDVLIGARLSTSEESSERLGRFRPCQSSVCDIVDGIVSSESFLGVQVPSILPEGVPVWVVVFAVVLPTLWVLLACYRCCQRRMMTQQYNPIVEENDLVLVNEDKQKDEYEDENE